MNEKTDVFAPAMTMWAALFTGYFPGHTLPPKPQAGKKGKKGAQHDAQRAKKETMNRSHSIKSGQKDRLKTFRNLSMHTWRSRTRKKAAFVRYMSTGKTSVQT